MSDLVCLVCGLVEEEHRGLPVLAHVYIPSPVWVPSVGDRVLYRQKLSERHPDYAFVIGWVHAIDPMYRIGEADGVGDYDSWFRAADIELVHYPEVAGAYQSGTVRPENSDSGSGIGGSS